MENLKNCPNCGGILDDLGRCEFCGSKVYDLCDIDVVTRGMKYIRIKTDCGIILAPVIVNTVGITCSQDSWPTMDIELMVCGNTIIQEIEKEESNGNT